MRFVVIAFMAVAFFAACVIDLGPPPAPYVPPHHVEPASAPAAAPAAAAADSVAASDAAAADAQPDR